MRPSTFCDCRDVSSKAISLIAGCKAYRSFVLHQEAVNRTEDSPSSHICRMCMHNSPCPVDEHTIPAMPSTSQADVDAADEAYEQRLVAVLMNEFGHELERKIHPAFDHALPRPTRISALEDLIRSYCGNDYEIVLAA
jgi:hypothetical protein